MFENQRDEELNIHYYKYGTMIEKFPAVFDTRIVDFRKLGSDFDIVSNPYNTAIYQGSECEQSFQR